jgi:hypothetical protein
MAINAPGQSDDPASPHYGDLRSAWAQGPYVPLPFSRAAVERAAEQIIELQPGRCLRRTALLLMVAAKRIAFSGCCVSCEPVDNFTQRFVVRRG